MRRLLLVLAAIVGFGALASTTFGVANAPPALRVESPPPVEATGPGGASVTYNVRAFDPLSGNPIGASCNPGGSGTGDFDVTATYPVGSTPVECTATLEDSSTVAKSITVTVQDTTPPVLTGLVDVSVSTTTASATVNYQAPSASDPGDVSNPVTVSCNPASGSVFSIGTTPILCTATDASHNSTSGSFNIIVHDDADPVFTLVPSDITTPATSSSGATVNYSISATDNSGSVSIACDPASGSVFPPTTTPVTCTASDASGNSTQTSFQVTVTPGDFDPPVFSNVPSNRTVEASSASGTVVNYANPTATDVGDGPVLVTCNPPSGSMFGLGTLTVTCSAGDSHGNTSTASFTISVVDTTKPSLIVPADRAVYADTPDGISAQSSAVASFLSQAQAVDSVDTHPTVSNDAPGFFSVGLHVVTFVASDASGNSVSKTATLDVRPQPEPGTTPPPLPIPPVRTPPHDVTGLKAEAGDSRVRLSWNIPNGVDHVVVTHQLSAGGDTQVVYTGSAESFTDRGLVNGLEYRYVVVSVDKNGNSSAGVAVVALPKATLLRSPKDGARLKKPPKLVWVRNSEATYYNVQVYRGAVKILSTWPVKPAVTLKRTWKYQGHMYKLTPGVYRWYVWPGFGARSAVDYGDVLGFSSFQIVR